MSRKKNFGKKKFPRSEGIRERSKEREQVERHCLSEELFVRRRSF